MVKKVKGLFPYDVGLGPRNFYLFVAGQKYPIANIESSETSGDADVQRWAKNEYKKWLKKRKFKDSVAHIKWAKGKLKKVI